MLNLEEIAQRIDNPQLCRVEELDDLKAMAEKYPYTQIFPILYLKGLSNHNHISFEEELTNFSYRISDRKQLYQLIHTHNTVESADLEIKAAELPPVDVKSEDTIVNSIDSVTSKRPEELIEQIIIEPLEIHPQPTIQEQIINAENEAIETVLIPLKSTPIEPHTLHESTPLDSKINEAACNDSFSLELLSTAISANYAVEPLENDETTIGFDEEESVVEELKESHDVTEKRSFTNWLKANENDTTQPFDEEKRKIDSLVNLFIQNEPKISRLSSDKNQEVKPKKEFFSPIKKAKESLDLTHMPVSETLAKIFALQGNYPKAIFVFEQLILKNPEKKVFFVAQIEELRKKLNTQ